MSNVHIREINDANGDLVDLQYFHHSHAPDDVPGWPAPESVDYPVYCGANTSGVIDSGCGERIHEVGLTRAGREAYGELWPEEIDRAARRERVDNARYMTEANE